MVVIRKMFNTNIPFVNHSPSFFSKSNYRIKNPNRNNFSNYYNYTNSFDNNQFFPPPYSNSYKSKQKNKNNDFIDNMECQDRYTNKNNENIYNTSAEDKNRHKSKEKKGLNNIFEINTDEVLFEIFGLKIYFDDVLLICILLFLYEEGIQDNCLFIALILLLLS